MDAQRVSQPTDETTYRKAVNQIRRRVNNVSLEDNHVHIFAFNVRPDQLDQAYALLDKQESRRAMRLTYSNEYNFIVRFVPSAVHNAAHMYWFTNVICALRDLTPPPHSVFPPGVGVVGKATFQIGPRRKEADDGLRPSQSDNPSIVMEVGDSESLTQLKIDAQLWIEHMPEVMLVILVSVDPPIAPNPTLPRIRIQLWRGFTPVNPPLESAQGAQGRVACMVWERDWTLAATPMYIPLADIFRGEVPPAYGNHTRVHLDTAGWRQEIIELLKLALNVEH